MKQQNETIETALNEIEGGKSISAVAKLYSLSKATLSRHVKSKKNKGFIENETTETGNETSNETLNETTETGNETDSNDFETSETTETGNETSNETLNETTETGNETSNETTNETAFETDETTDETTNETLETMSEDNAVPCTAGAGAGENGGYEADTMSVSWAKVQELKEWIESMGQDKNKIFERWVTWRAAYLDWTDELAQMRCRMEHQRDRANALKNIITKTFSKEDFKEILKKDKEIYGNLIVWNGKNYKEYHD